MKSFPWRFAVYFVAAIYLFLDLIVWEGPLWRRLTRPWDEAGDADSAGAHVAMVYGRPITRLELAEAMRAYLWQTGESWGKLGENSRSQMRQLVLETLVQGRMVTAFRKMNGLDEPVSEAAVEEEWRLLQQQTGDAEGLEQRLAAQLLDGEGMRAKIRERLNDRAWLEEKMAHRLEEIREREVREWYENHRDELMVPKRYRAAHLFLTAHDPEMPDRSGEVGLLEREIRLVGREGWAALVAGHSEDERTRSLGGDLGWFSAERMPADFMEAVVKADVGEVTGPVRTHLGWHWIRLDEVRSARVPGFEEVSEEVGAFLRSERRGEAIKALMRELRERSLMPTCFLHYQPGVIATVEPAE